MRLHFVLTFLQSNLNQYSLPMSVEKRSKNGLFLKISTSREWIGDLIRAFGIEMVLYHNLTYRLAENGSMMS